MNPTALQAALRDTVQELPDAKKDNGASASSFWSVPLERGPLLAAWGTRQREWQLRWYDRHNYNTLWQGASSGLAKKFATTPSQLSGGRNLTKYFDDIFRYASFHGGQIKLKKLVGRDYLRFDGGAYVEIIAPGDPRRDPTGRARGLAVLDSYQCTPTGDPTYPVLYTDRLGKQHLMRYTRIMHFVDTPDSDQNNPGYGLCALSRAIAVVERQLLANRYVVTKLDDKPPPGMLLVGGMTRQAWNTAWGQYRQDQGTDERPEWGRVLPLFGADADLTPKVESVAFSNAPENFDYKVYVELDVHEFALAIGVDIQELWELTSGNLGSAGQSEIQHSKSRGNTLGDLLTEWEVGVNNYVLPEPLEYEHKVRDPYEAQERAENANQWVNAVNGAGSKITAEEGRRILANQIEAFADAIMDENGELIRLPSEDAIAPEETELVIDSETPSAPAADMGEPVQLEVVKDFTPLARLRHIQVQMTELRAWVQMS